MYVFYAVNELIESLELSAPSGMSTQPLTVIMGSKVATEEDGRNALGPEKSLYFMASS